MSIDGVKNWVKQWWKVALIMVGVGVVMFLGIYGWIYWTMPESPSAEAVRNYKRIAQEARADAEKWRDQAFSERQTANQALKEAAEVRELLAAALIERDASKEALKEIKDEIETLDEEIEAVRRGDRDGVGSLRERAERLKSKINRQL
jgi:ribosomal protein S21